MTFDVVFLGTGAAVPVPTRGTTSQFVDIHGHSYLIDAGEGVQLSLRKHRRRFQKLKGIFISHMHGDHVLGLPGLLSTMSLLGRNEPIDIWGPPALETWMAQTWKSIECHMNFLVNFKCWSDSESVVLFESERYRLTSFPVKHRIACCGLKIEEHSLPWRLDGEKAKSAGLPYQIRQQLKRGGETLFDGQILEPSRWCTPPPKARSYVYAADTRPCEKVLLASKNVTVLYHDATFVEADADKAKSTYHSTSLECARLAAQAKVDTLILGHISLRYKDTRKLLEEAKTRHANVIAAEDGMVCSVDWS